MNVTIENVSISSLRPRGRNPRTHSKKQINQIADSIREFGFLNPVLVDGECGIIAGHGRVEGAKLLGMTEVPAVRIDHLTEAQIRAYVIADNKLALKAGWDMDLLRLEMKELSENLHFELTLTGFETGEIDEILIGDAPDPDDEVPVIDASRPAVSRLGDLWRIGSHFVLCGDATKADSYQAVLQGEQAQVGFTDPPSNVRIKRHVSGLGKAQHEEFAMASGEMSSSEFETFLSEVFRNLAGFSEPASIHYICMDWRHMGEVLEAAKDRYTELKNLCVWTKTNGGMGSFYRSQHELLFVYQSGPGSHINNVELGKYGNYRTNVWSYAGMTTFGATRNAELALPPTVKPVAMVADAIKDASKRNGIILDAFGGSGTTLLAAHRTGRRGYALEIAPQYVNVIVRRMEEATGEQAVLQRTNETFADVRELRALGLD